MESDHGPLRPIVEARPDGALVLACWHTVDGGASGRSGLGAGDAVGCPGCAARLLPAATTPGRRTPTFTADTVPPALLRDHRTAAWARLEVSAGSVRFAEDEPRWQAVAEPRRPVVIVPGRAHRISPSADARFAVQFFDPPLAPG